ncbi:hypothetical protein RJ639_035404 [Escallonia herrerae]|uniref:Uncharacterized protein n=1 Tax=Escallonia herrerae TaxID=1293975 RepID=A0AA89B9U9_9ASTE|nr:hypothetical protein RJ639_035404 [Escallonia herrerae]
MEKPSWVCTFATQLSLCCALYLVINMGRPQKPVNHSRSEREPMDIYFISVVGGLRPFQEQTHLLKLMEMMVKAHKASFVINISELGEDDPLLQNATLYFQSLKVPWYTTTALKGQEADYFFKRINISFGNTMDVIALGTGSLQDSSNGDSNDQLNWLTRTLEGSSSNWRIVVGFHPLVACVENIKQLEAKQHFEPLQGLLLKYGVNAYLSQQACAHHVGQVSMAHINSAGPIKDGPYITTVNKKLALHQDLKPGFLLHRVSSLEMSTERSASAWNLEVASALELKWFRAPSSRPAHP